MANEQARASIARIEAAFRAANIPLERPSSEPSVLADRHDPERPVYTVWFTDAREHDLTGAVGFCAAAPPAHWTNPPKDEVDEEERHWWIPLGNGLEAAHVAAGRFDRRWSGVVDLHQGEPHQLEQVLARLRARDLRHTLAAFREHLKELLTQAQAPDLLVRWLASLELGVEFIRELARAAGEARDEAERSCLARATRIARIRAVPTVEIDGEVPVVSAAWVDIHDHAGDILTLAVVPDPLDAARDAVGAKVPQGSDRDATLAWLGERFGVPSFANYWRVLYPLLMRADTEVDLRLGGRLSAHT